MNGYISPNVRKEFNKQKRKLNKLRKDRIHELYKESKNLINYPASQGLIHRELLALELRELGVTAKEFREWWENEQVKH